MTPPRITLLRLVAGLSLIATALAGLAPGAIADEHGTDRCEGGSNAYFSNFQAGGFTFTTQAGTHTLNLPIRELALAFGGSTTGDLDVDVTFRCIEGYHVVVEQVGGTNAGIVYDQWVTPGCGSGVDTHHVPIGLDAGEFQFHLEWYGCDGTKGRDYRDAYIVDPPLPVARLG